MVLRYLVSQESNHDIEYREGNNRMPQYFRVLGRVAGQAFKSQAVDRAITVAVDYVLSEMRLADVRARRVLLRRKRANHLSILGRTVYRLVDNNIEPMNDEHTLTIIRVLEEIDEEIRIVDEEIKRRREYEADLRRKSAASSHQRKGGPDDSVI